MRRATELYGTAKFALFATSYAPLFLLIIGKQIYDNFAFLHFGGFNIDALICFLSKFFIATVLIIVTFIGIIGCLFLFSNLKKKQGNSVKIVDVTNRNSESVGYIATYIIPFLFQDFSSIYEVFAIIFMLIIIYTSYVNSNMLLINPVLNIFKYSLFEVQFESRGIKKSGLVIIRDSAIEENSNIKLSPIGFKLYYANNQ